MTTPDQTPRRKIDFLTPWQQLAAKTGSPLGVNTAPAPRPKRRFLWIDRPESPVWEVR